MKLTLRKYLFGGKNGTIPYWAVSYTRYLLPIIGREQRLQAILREAESRSDYDYIMERVDFYNKLQEKTPLPASAHTIKDYTLCTDRRAALKSSDTESLAKPYFFDSNEVLRWFPSHLRYAHAYGDVTTSQPVPSITKTRPILGDNSNNILLNLDKNRHFVFLRDTIPFREKKDTLICRCSINGQPQRFALFRNYFGQPWADLAFVGNNDGYPNEWEGKKITLYKHLEHKFIACFEGNDVASNMKWVMSSNSVAIACQPKYESWFMESRLIPNHHYICVKPDLSDLEEKLRYYAAHPEECESIVRNAHEYVAQFMDSRRELTISLLVMRKYFQMTGQM